MQPVPSSLSARPGSPDGPHKARPRRRWARVGFGVAVGILLSEGLVRAVRRFREPPDERTSRLIHRASDDPELIYELVPGASGVRDGVPIVINDDGFRDDPFPAEGNRTGLRIVVLGDSVAWGWGVEMPQAFPQVLERELNAARPPDAPPHVVFNLAVDGYSTTQEVRLLETRTAAFNPDRVILAYVLNDPDVADGGLARHFTSSPIALVELLHRGWRRATEPPPPPFDGRNWDHEYHFYIHAKHKTQVETDFARLGRWRREHDVPILVAVVPVMLFEPGAPYPWQYLHDYIASLCRKEGLESLDLYEAFAGRSADGLKLDEWHPNAEGHAMIAEALRTFIQATSSAPRDATEPRP